MSYTAPAGHYAFADEALAYHDINAAPLTVPGGYPNPGGVFGDPGTFPTQTFGAPHYYVDALFSTVDTSPADHGLLPALRRGHQRPGHHDRLGDLLQATGHRHRRPHPDPGRTTRGRLVAYDSTTRKVTFTPDALVGR